MKKRPFAYFIVIVSTLVASMLWFIQSPHFARIVKGVLARHLPADLGVAGDFSEFAIKLFPPGISINNPKISLLEHNILKLPGGATLTAKRVELGFRPIQMFSGRIRVQEVTVVDGDVYLPLDLAELEKKASKKPTPQSSGVHWDNLFQIRAEAVALHHTHVRVQDAKGGKTPFYVDLMADYLRLGQWITTVGGLGFELDLNLSDVKGSPLDQTKLPFTLDRISSRARVNAQGLEVESLKATGNQLEVNANATIKGNILDPKHLPLEATVIAQGPIAPLLKAFAYRGIDADGDAHFEGKVHGDLKRIEQSLRLEGTLSARKAHYQKWRVEKLDAEGSWTAGPHGGEVFIKKASASSPETPRIGGRKFGDGGHVEVGPVRFQFAQSEPFTVPVQFKGAHIHWLAAPGAKVLFPLSFRATGSVQAEVSLPRKDRSWMVRTDLDLSADDLVLDNQRIDQMKSELQIFKVPKVLVKGPAHLDSTGILLGGVLVQLPKSQLKAEGKIDFKSGLDFTAKGNVLLDDVATIAESQVRGEGGIQAHIHGPLSRVMMDFDVDLKEVYYLKLKLGQLKGRITWDDDPAILHFSQVKGLKGKSPYFVNGTVDLGKVEAPHLDIQIPEGNIQDYIRVFEDLTRNLWWFPQTLSGVTQGNVSVGGKGLAMSKLEVGANLTGSNWEYLAERFKTVHLTGGYDRGKFYLSDFRSIKHSGGISGRISFDADERFDWEFKTDGFTLSDLNHFAQLDVPVRGGLSIRSSGSGKSGALESNTQVAITDTAIRGIALPSSSAILTTKSGIASIKGTLLGGQASLETVYNFAPNSNSRLQLELKQLDFTPVLLLINPKAIRDKSLSGLTSAVVDISFQSGAIERGSGRIALSQYVLSKAGSRFELASPIESKMTDGSFEVQGLTLRGKDEEATLHLTSDRANLEGTVSGRLDLSIVEFFTPTILQAQGTADLDFALGGTIKSPTIYGRANIEGRSLRVPEIESPFENITGSLLLRQNLVTVQSLRSDLAGGMVSADGTITLFADRYPSIAIRGTIAGSKIKIYPFQYIKVRGGVEIRGDDIPYPVEGAITVESALSKEKVINKKQGEVLKALQYTPPPSKVGEGHYPKFKLNIRATAERGVLIQNDLFDAEAKGDLVIVNTLETPRILGNADIIQGKMTFKDRIFQIQSAHASFKDTTTIDPEFNLTASTDVNDVKVQLYVAGRTTGNWKIELTSNPVMPEAEIITLLALGVTPNEAKRLSSGFEKSEAASLLLHSMDFNREVTDKTGVQIQLDESVDTQLGTSVFRPQSQADIAAPKIVIRKKIGKKLELSAGGTVGVGTNTQREVNAEYQVTPGFSLIGVWNSYERGSESNRPSSFGLDLKLQKRFE